MNLVRSAPVSVSQMFPELTSRERAWNGLTRVQDVLGAGPSAADVNPPIQVAAELKTSLTAPSLDTRLAESDGICAALAAARQLSLVSAPIALQFRRSLPVRRAAACDIEDGFYAGRPVIAAMQPGDAGTQAFYTGTIAAVMP